MPEQALVVAIPSRNRADLVEIAVRSVLEDLDTQVHLLVSDNSSESEERERMRNLRHAFSDVDVTWMHPPGDLAMTAHWEWLLGQALALPSTSHVAFLTDRMLFKPGALGIVRALLSRYPDRVITYNHDLVEDSRTPVSAQAFDWSGKLFELNCQRILAAAAKGDVYGHLYPRMLNTVAPRRLFEQMQRHHGSVFTSVSPDFSFAFRCLAREASILHLDRSLLIAHGTYRSNGAGFGHGGDSRDTEDFKRSLSPGTLNAATPLPELQTVANAIAHEYCTVRREFPNRLPPLQLKGYLASNAAEIPRVADPADRARMLVALRRAGWTRKAELLARLRWAVTRASWFLHPRAALARMAFAYQRLQERLGWRLPGALTFPSSVDAIEYLRTHDGLRVWWPCDLRWTIEGPRLATRLPSVRGSHREDISSR